MDINLNYFKIFYVVAKHGNITKASQKLYISQPAISQTIKNLEDALGCKLFIREKKGVALTHIGKRIYEKVESSLKSLDRLEELVDEENGVIRGSLTIGCGTNIARLLLAEPIAKFVKDFPEVKVYHVENLQKEMFEKLKTGEIDFVLTQSVDNVNFSKISLSKENYLLVASPNSQKRFIKLTDGSYAQKIFEEFIEKNKLNHLPYITVAGYNLAIELACRGLGITLAPRFLVKNLIDEGKLNVVFENKKLPEVEFCCYYNKDIFTSVAREFINYLLPPRND